MKAKNTTLTRSDFDIHIHGHRLRVCSLRHDKASKNTPTVVFLHDSLGCIATWRDFPETIARATGCHALVYDRQGFGQSAPFSTPRTIHFLEDEAHLLPRVLEQCEVTSAILFGHSDGATISLLAAAEYPQLVLCVISEAAHVFVDHQTITGILHAKELYIKSNLRTRIARYHGSKTDAVFRAWTETWLAEWYQHWNIEKYLSRIQCPVLVIQGERDEYGTLGQIDAIAGQVGGVVQKHLLPCVGHTPHKEVPDEIEKLSVTFIKKYLLRKKA
jgi:pimeloyl-ACP methyl ester carboxylesterase